MKMRDEATAGAVISADSMMSIGVDANNRDTTKREVAILSKVVSASTQKNLVEN